MTQYILDENKEPVRCEDLLEWGTWLKNNPRHVGDETIDGVRVSTVFLGLDHGFAESGPLLFETMIFGGKHDGYCDRCGHYDSARRQHEYALKLVKGEIKDDDEQ